MSLYAYNYQISNDNKADLFFLGKNSLTDPISDLWIHVLLQAIDDLKLPLKDSNSSVLWFLSTRNGIGSFDWICNEFNLPKHKILTSVARFINMREKEHVKPRLKYV